MYINVKPNTQSIQEAKIQMDFSTVFDHLKSDAARYPKVLTHPGFWVTASYRIRRFRKSNGINRFLLLPLDILLGILRSFVSDTHLPASIEIGPGLYLPHPNGILINSKVTIGSNVTIFQHVTIGEWHDQAPVIEDNSSIFAGAKVFGGITVGANSKVGANCVLNEDIPPNSVASTSCLVVRQRSTRTS